MRRQARYCFEPTGDEVLTATGNICPVIEHAALESFRYPQGRDERHDWRQPSRINLVLRIDMHAHLSFSESLSGTFTGVGKASRPSSRLRSTTLLHSSHLAPEDGPAIVLRFVPSHLLLRDPPHASFIKPCKILGSILERVPVLRRDVIQRDTMIRPATWVSGS